MNLEKLDKCRLMDGAFATKPGDRFGFFFIRFRLGSLPLKVMAAPFDDSQEWEHVSVSLPNRCPTWEEMCFIKELFWKPGDCVIQFHPPESEYVNNVKHCLHLWRNTKNPTPTPPSLLVGIKGLEFN